ncbi:MAG: hypothetical protein ACUZ8H_09845 [Candidatus Anammoxibacter sp.]
MTKAEENKKALIAEQKKNYEEMNKMIAQVSDPDEKDVNYLQGVMKNNKYNRGNRKELTAILDQMEADLKPKDAITFETPAQKKAAQTVSTAKELTKGIAPNLMTDRAAMFTEIRKDLFELSEKCLVYARKQAGGAALRLNTVSTNLTRMAKTTLRE